VSLDLRLKTEVCACISIIDGSNTFFYGETNLDGILDLVSRSNPSRNLRGHPSATC
jgi:hypothetical protein